MIDLHDIERLQAKGALQETVFRSRLPVIGPLVAWLRAAWNSVSTKWYVRPLIAQQSEFNACVVGQLRGIAEQFHSQEARFAEIDRRFGETDRQLGEIDRQLGEIDRRLTEQAERFAQQLTGTIDRLGAHEGRLHDLGAWLIAQDREQSEAIHDLAELRTQLGQVRKRFVQVSASMPQGDADHQERSG